MTDKTPSEPEKKDTSNEGFEFPSLHDQPAEKAEPENPTVSSDSPSKIESVKSQMLPLYQKGASWFASHKTAGLLIGFAVVALGMYGISVIRRDPVEEETADGTSAPDVIPVNAVEVRMGRFQDEINAVGNLKGEVEIELRFEVDGTIHEFGVSEGAKVNKGQLIARLSDKDAQLKVQRARIELEQNEKLFQLGGVSKTKLDEARLNLDVAQSEFDKTRIVAAREGILGDKSAYVGEFVTPQRKIATLVAIKNVVVEVGIIEKQIDKVYPGQKILVLVDAYPGNVFEGKIETISPLISQDGSKTFSIRAIIPNPDSLLLPGMFARTRIITYEADDALSVPNDALVKTAGGFQVFVVASDPKAPEGESGVQVAEARDVEVGYVATENTQIKGGLNAGEVVIVQKPQELKAGSKVKIIEVQKP